MIYAAASCAVIAIASIVAACGGGTGTPHQTCVALPVPAPPPMIYPQPGATGVPDGNFVMVLAFSYAQATSLMNGSNSVGPLAPTAVPSPLPSGAGTPFPEATPAAYSVPALQHATTYTVSASFAVQTAGCPSQEIDVGAFTTK